jgi:hypothetical protein
MKATGSRASFVFPALLVAGAASLALALGLLAGGGPALAGTDHAEQARAAVPARQVAFREDMRVLWEDHVTWTRMAIVDFAAGSPGLAATQARLLRNQTDIGDAIAPFYGKAAGTRLTALLREHILIAVDVLVAAKGGDATGLSAAQARWVRNADADAIAAFLSTANPDAWPRAEMRSMMRHHLKLTTDEAVARLTGDWRGDVRAYDKVHVQALHMADMLSAGIIDQFPRRLR